MERRSTLRPMTGLSLPALGIVLLAGCAGANIYDPQSWNPPANTEKVTSDWDVAGGICDKIAQGTELTAAEKAQIEDDREIQMMYARTISDMGSQMADMAAQTGGDPSIGHAGQAIGAAMSLVSAFSGATAGEDKKDATYKECMEKLDWELKNGG